MCWDVLVLRSYVKLVLGVLLNILLLVEGLLLRRVSNLFIWLVNNLRRVGFFVF